MSAAIETPQDEKTPSAEEVLGKLTRALESRVQSTEDGLLARLDAVAESLETSRSRKPPIPAREEKPAPDERVAPSSLTRSRVEGFDVTCIRVLGDVREQQYSRLYRGLSGSELLEKRAARNVKMDDLTQRWIRAVDRQDYAMRAKLCEEMNDLYLDTLGIERAPLLIGDPTGENPLADGSGAELVPLPLANQIVLARDRASKLRRISNVFPMTSQTERVPMLPIVTASTRAENAPYVDNTPAADKAMLTATDLGVQFSAGRNFLDDTAFNMANALTQIAGAAIGAREDVEMCTADGTGSSFTEGLTNANIVDIPETTPSSLAYVDIVALYYGLQEQYRQESVFLMEGTTLQDVMNIVDGNGRPIFRPADEAPIPIGNEDSAASGILFGKPVYEVPLPDDEIIFGNMGWYAYGNRTSIRVDTDREVTTGERTWVIDQRGDGRTIPTTTVAGLRDAFVKMIY